MIVEQYRIADHGRPNSSPGDIRDMYTLSVWKFETVQEIGIERWWTGARTNLPLTVQLFEYFISGRRRWAPM